MIYLKIPKEEFAFHLHECKDDIKIDIYDDFFYTKCPKCGRSHNVEIEIIQEMLENGDDFATGQVYCEKCSKKLKN